MKSDNEHNHDISDISSLQSILDEKASSSHGAHVTFSNDTPKIDGAASAGTSATVARSDHIHPIDTSRASQDDLNTVEHLASLNKAAIEANTSAINAMQTNIEALAAKIKLHEESLENFAAISSQEINGLF